MHEKFHIEDRVFDRLVDGELSSAERKELLASLDRVPNGWRRCALSFLEGQAWRECFGQVVNTAAASPSAESNASKSLAQQELRVSGNDFETGSNSQEPRTQLAKSEQQPAERGFHWLAIAASLLVAFTLGVVVRDGNRAPTGGQAATNGVQIADVVPPPGGALANDDNSPDALTFFVRDDSGQTRPLRVPLVDAGALEQQLGLQFQSGVPAHVRSQLQTRGFDVHSKQRYAPLWLENGRPMFVPVEDTRIVPVGRNVY